MSPRHWLNMTMGAAATLLVVSVAVVVFTLDDQDSGRAQADLAARQQVLIQDLAGEVAAFADADELSTAKQARVRMGRTIHRFDQALSGLVHGGSVELENGKKVEMEPVSDSDARDELRKATELWLKIGPPLADLAAGEYSVFSAAGQQAMKGLDTNRDQMNESMGAVAASLDSGLATSSMLATGSRWATAILAGLLTVLGFIRFAFGKKRSTADLHEPRPAPERATLTDLTDDFETPRLQPAPAPVPEPFVEAFSSPVDFDTVSASVDQMSVDMNTIASSTDKMRLAIDSVGHALQGMLYSLKEMSEDTAEGHRIVTNASNAARFTSDTAGQLSLSAQEMSRVVGQVTQLAQTTRQIAAQIETEAVATERSGEGLNSVIATEVRGLAHQTSTATLEIDETVSTVLSTARQYEEAIGQILKNVAAIDRVTQGMESSLLDLPPRNVHRDRIEPVPLNPTSGLDSRPTTAPDGPDDSGLEMLTAHAEELEEPVMEDPTPEEVVEETSAAIEEAADEPDSEVIETDEEPNLQKAFRLPAIEDPVEDPPEATDESGDLEDEAEDDAVFMLGKDALASRQEEESEAEESPEPEPVVEAAVAEVEAPADSADAEDDDESHVFMLKKSDVHKMDPEADDDESDAEPEAAVAEVQATEESEEFSEDQTVFILNKPKQTV